MLNVFNLLCACVFVSMNESPGSALPLHSTGRRPGALWCVSV